MERAIWTTHGDLQKAFPRTWRAGMLLRLAQDAGLQAGLLHTICSSLQADHVIITLGGTSVVTVHEGVPEGGQLGPLGFNTLPDALVRMLQARRLGVGVGVTCPPQWQGMAWRGDGVPEESLVAMLVEALQTGAALPHCDLLRAQPALEASALRALDLIAPIRIVAVLHADDPVFLGSSRGGLQLTLNGCAEWAHLNKATFHITSAKTVTMVCGPEACRLGQPHTPLLLPTAGREAVQLTVVPEHIWLGFLWRADLDLLPAAKARIRCASGPFSCLCGMATTGDLPLAMAAAAFESKVDGTMRHGP